MKTIVIFLTGVLLSTPPVVANGKLGISLYTFDGGRHIQQSSQDPLLLFVSIDHVEAIVVMRDNARNKELLDQYSKTEAYTALTEGQRGALIKDYPVREVPVITLGSKTVSLESLINIQVRNERGEATDLVIRPLAENDHSATPITLNVDETLYYQFVIEEEQLQQLSPGIYRMAASIDTTEQQGMWQGWSYSNEASFSLDKSPDKAWLASNQRAVLYSTYLLQDQKFANAEQHARQWAQQYPDSVDAWHHLGQALYGQRKNEDALPALNTALAKFRQKYGDSPAELPLVILDLIEKL
jgi:hypothetical protein